jgi:hypothetical protein
MIARPTAYVEALNDGYAGVVARALDHVGFFERTSPGARVFLKPNLTYPEYRPGS